MNVHSQLYTERHTIFSHTTKDKHLYVCRHKRISIKHLHLHVCVNNLVAVKREREREREREGEIERQIDR